MDFVRVQIDKENQTLKKKLKKTRRPDIKNKKGYLLLWYYGWRKKNIGKQQQKLHRNKGIIPKP